jgi:hypothetical protein
VLAVRREEHDERGRRTDVVDHPAKVHPEEPAMTVSGRKVTVTRVSRSLIVPERRDSVLPSTA